MSATAPAAPTIDVSSTPSIPFGHLFGVELRKTYDTRAGFWLLATIAAIVTLIDGIVLIVDVLKDDVNPSFGDYTAGAAIVTSILLPVLGIMLVTSEWSQRTAMITFALEPRRIRVVMAKLAVGVLLSLATVVVSLAVGALFNAVGGLITGGASWSGFSVTDIVGFTLLQTIAMVSGFALAALTLNTPAAIVVYFAYRFVVPTIFGLGSAFLDWFDNLSQWIDFQRAQGPLADLSLNSGSEWGHLLVSGAIWLGIPLVLGLRRILSAEVK